MQIKVKFTFRLFLCVTALQYGGQLVVLLWSQCFGEDNTVFWGTMSYNVVQIYYWFPKNLLPPLSGFICSTFQKTVLLIVTAITSNLIHAVAVTECKQVFSPVFEPKFKLGNTQVCNKLSYIRFF